MCIRDRVIEGRSRKEMEQESQESWKMCIRDRIDDLQNGYYIIQDPRKFCFGMDAVLLSGFARVKKGEKVLDMGTGTGIIPVLLASKTVGEHFTGLEIQEECAEMAARSVKYNNLEDRVLSLIHIWSVRGTLSRSARRRFASMDLR